MNLPSTHGDVNEVRPELRLIVFGIFWTLVCFVWGWSPAAEAQKTDANLPAVGAQESQDANPRKRGLNDAFKDPQLDLEQWLGRFEIESREVFAARKQVLKACDVKAGQCVADVGAGTGFYSRLFADSVGEDGWVYAVDIAPGFLSHINEQSTEAKISNVTSVLCTERSVCLPPESVDFVFVCDTYHHFEFYADTLASIYSALRPGGSMVVIDFERIPGKSRDWILGHVRAGKQEFREEIESAGFEFVREVTLPEFSENYLLKFRKPERTS